LKNFKRILTVLLFIFLIAAICISIAGGGFGKKDFPLSEKLERAPLLFSHRAMRYYAPENTLAAIRMADSLNFPAIEIDIRQTADGFFILFHDESAQDLLNIHKTIEELNLNEIEKIQIRYNGMRSASTIYLLEDFFRNFRQRFIVYLDVKTNGNKNRKAMADKIIALIYKYNMEKNVIVGNADFFFQCYIECCYPEIYTALEGFDSGKEWQYNIVPKKFRTDFVAGFLVKTDEDQIDWLKKHNMLDRKIVYGVDNEKDFRRARNLGLEKMILDYGPHLDSLLVKQ
jgi:hypothetical protein